MRLMNELPEGYLSDREVTELQEAIEKASNATEAAQEELLAQFYIDTATWSIDLWEGAYGVEIDAAKPIEQRRNMVKAKMRGSGTTTVDVLKNMSESFVNGEVDVAEYTAEYRFEVIMRSIIGIPPNMEDLKRAIEEAKPAHLAYEIILRYNTWGMVQDTGMTWAMAAQRTWKDMKGVKLDGWSYEKLRFSEAGAE